MREFPSSHSRSTSLRNSTIGTIIADIGVDCAGVPLELLQQPQQHQHCSHHLLTTSSLPSHLLITDISSPTHQHHLTILVAGFSTPHQHHLTSLVTGFSSKSQRRQWVRVNLLEFGLGLGLGSGVFGELHRHRHRTGVSLRIVVIVVGFKIRGKLLKEFENHQKLQNLQNKSSRWTSSFLVFGLAFGFGSGAHRQFFKEKKR